MTTNKALQILFDESSTYYDFCDDSDKHRALEWAGAWNHMRYLGQDNKLLYYKYYRLDSLL